MKRQPKRKDNNKTFFEQIWSPFFFKKDFEQFTIQFNDYG